MTAAPVLILPGYGDSGPDHWQTRWERLDPALVRVHQRSWEAPRRDEWVAALDAAVRAAGPRVVLAAHSLACLAVAQWVAQGGTAAGALLVAPPDPAHRDFPPAIEGFGDLASARFPFPATLVSSTDDPYCDAGFAARCAARWGAREVSIGAAGHINGASRLGDWPAGWALLQELRGAAR